MDNIIKIRLLNGLPIRLDELGDARRQFNTPDSSVMCAFNKAHLYMLCRQPSSRFSKIQQSDTQISFDWVQGDEAINFIFDINEIRQATGCAGGIDTGINRIAFDGEKPFIVTPSSLPFDLIHEAPGFHDVPHTLTEVHFNVDYIGKALSQVAFERLVVHPHKKFSELLLDKVIHDQDNKLDILILLFEISGFSHSIALNDIISEVEMMLISKFRPKYNGIKYTTYPNNSSSQSTKWDPFKLEFCDPIRLWTEYLET